MTQRETVDLHFSAFFGVNQECQQFQELLRETLRRQAAISATIELDGVRLSLREQTETAPKIQLGGAWHSEDFHLDGIKWASSKLFLPYLFEIGEVAVFHDQIFTLGRSYRPISDFFMRNLFLAFIRDEAVFLYRSDIDGSSKEALANFMRQYYFIFKATFPEPSLEGRHSGEAIDLITANAYLPVLDFINPLLSIGTQKIQNFRLNCDQLKTREILVADLQNARAKMLEHFK